MEKFPQNKSSHMEKVARAALAGTAVLGAVAETEPAAADQFKLKQDIETQQNISKPQTVLAEQLKKTTDEYFKQEVNRTNKGNQQRVEDSHFKDFHKSEHIEDRRDITPEFEDKIAQEAQIKGKLEYIRETTPILKTFLHQTREDSERLTPLGAKLGMNEIEPLDKRSKEEAERKATEIDIKTRLGVATPEEMDDRGLYGQ